MPTEMQAIQIQMNLKINLYFRGTINSSFIQLPSCTHCQRMLYDFWWLI